MSADPRIVLARLAASPEQARSLPPEDAAIAAAYASELQAALAQRLRVTDAEAHSKAPPPADRLLTPAETAARLGVTKRWLYRNSKRLPFTRKLTNRTVRFHEQGLAKYIRERKP